MITSGSMPGGVTMAAAFAGAGGTLTEFNPIGMTTGRNGTVTLTNQQGRTMAVVVNNAGTIRIQ